ncbi:unnamed protein product (macronuclear) [Paramecium tetraurelia]|uniref:K Homology domain-containing protein n=1 Tax=Paramecium tetraurelia TaxID=5888 RepID=A0CWS9_PARTE|nr:uncharacterized protein GSPATT00001449001 [Paramecium tetraurelia]CAK75246.1 unnamed protein product [Paramecium tetraurelia]|eukprot:XP_001442643.1 hypothetical protein (macronuclear) [Paramecium tetraurelia strain d4-2]
MSKDIADEQGLSGQSSRSSSPQEQSRRKRQFQIHFFIEWKYIKSEELKNILEDVKSQYDIKSIQLNRNNQIPGLEGTAFSIIDYDDNKLNSQLEAINKILQLIEQKKNPNFEMMMLIPEGTVSYLIGTSGKQIKNIQQETKTDVVVNNAINKFSLRSVKIVGQANCIFNAIKLITNKLHQRGITEDDYIKRAEPLDPGKVVTKVQLVFLNIIVDYILKNKDLEKKYQLKMKAKSSNEIPIKNKLKKDEEILQLVGTLKNVQEAIKSIVRRISSQFKKLDFDIRVVMPANFASKLIGASKQSSYIIFLKRAAKQKNLQTKPKEHKQKQCPIRMIPIQDNLDCLVQVIGSVEHKLEATVLILEQIECFKNGGPILESGKYINENFAQQYKNSVSLQDMKPKRNLLLPALLEEQDPDRNQTKDIKNKENLDQLGTSNQQKSSNQQKIKQNPFQTKIVVPIYLIEEIQKKLNRIGKEEGVHIQAGSREFRDELVLKLRGEMKNCLTVIQYILSEQCKLQRR